MSGSYNDITVPSQKTVIIPNVVLLPVQRRSRRTGNKTTLDKRLLLAGVILNVTLHTTQQTRDVYPMLGQPLRHRPNIKPALGIKRSCLMDSSIVPELGGFYLC